MGTVCSTIRNSDIRHRPGSFSFHGMPGFLEQHDEHDDNEHDRGHNDGRVDSHMNHGNSDNLKDNERPLLSAVRDEEAEGEDGNGANYEDRTHTEAKAGGHSHSYGSSFIQFSRAFDLLDKTTLAASGLLMYEHHPILRSCAILVTLLLMFFIGAGLTSFPIWLNEGIATHVDISSADLNLLGAVVYVSMGLCCLLVIAVRYWCSRDRHVQFTLWSILGAVALVAGWGLGIWLVHTGTDTEGGLFKVFKHNIYNAMLVMALVGSGSAVFYVIWLCELVKLLKPEYAQGFWTAANALLALGASAALAGKLHLSSWHMIVWRGLATFAILALALGLVLPNQVTIFSPLVSTIVAAGGRCTMHLSESNNNGAGAGAGAGAAEFRNNVGGDVQQLQQLQRRHNNIHPEDGTLGSVSAYTFALLEDLILYRRDYSRLQCRTDQYCDMSSRQFYSITLTLSLLLAVGSTFLSVFGVLAQHRGDPNAHTAASTKNTDITGSDMVDMALYLSLGDLFSRVILSPLLIQGLVEAQTPVVTYAPVQPVGIGDHTVNHNNNNSSSINISSSSSSVEARMRARTRMALGVTRRHVGMARPAHIQNKIVLLSTTLASISFLLSTCLLRYFPDSVTFVQASTLMGIGYGLVWCMVARYPLFFPNSDFTVMFSLLLALGAGFTFIYVEVARVYLTKNCNLYDSMLALSTIALFGSVMAYIDRRHSEVQLTQPHVSGYQPLGLEREVHNQVHPPLHHSRSGKMKPPGSEAACRVGSHNGPGTLGGSHQGRHTYFAGDAEY